MIIIMADVKEIKKQQLLHSTPPSILIEESRRENIEHLGIASSPVESQPAEQPPHVHVQLPQVYQGDLIIPHDYNVFTFLVALFCAVFATFTFPCAITAMVLTKMVS